MSASTLRKAKKLVESGGVIMIEDDLFQIKSNIKKPAKQEYNSIMENYIQEIHKLSIAVDQIS